MSTTTTPSESLTDPTTESQISLGFADEANPNPPHTAPIKAQPNSEKYLPVVDQCCLIFYHVAEEKVLLAGLKHKGFFLPYIEHTLYDSAVELVTALGQQLLRETQGADIAASMKFQQPQLVSILRIQSPKHLSRYYNRYIFSLAIGAKGSGAELCMPADKFKSSSGASGKLSDADGLEYLWFGEAELKASKALWGPEPYECLVLMRTLYGGKNKRRETTLKEISLSDMLSILNSTKSAKEKDLLRSALFTEDALEKLANEFVIQCFPSEHMSYLSFRLFMDKLGWMNEPDLVFDILFRSLALEGTKTRPVMYLTFHELIVGLAAMEENADHRIGNCLLLRLKYIFYFYDNDMDGCLNVQELGHLVADIAGKEEENEMKRVMTEIFQRLTKCTEVTEKSVVTCKQMIDAAMTEANRAWLASLTFQLFRSKISTIQVASARFDYKPSQEVSKALRAHGAWIRYEGCCHRCRVVRYALCSHGIKINDQGMIRATFKFDRNVKYTDIAFVQDITMEENTFTLVDTLQHQLALLAIDRLEGKQPPATVAPDQLSKYFEVLRLAKEVLRNEPLLVCHGSPCVLIGEIASNLIGLHLLISKMKRMAPFVNPTSIVFLGNYLKPEGDVLAVETFIYLLCVKVLLPKRITLLRGRGDQPAQLKAFKAQCAQKYGPKMFNAILQVLRFLPSAVLLDGCVFVSHSGIPLTSTKLDKLNVANISTSNLKVPKSVITFNKNIL